MLKADEVLSGVFTTPDDWIYFNKVTYDPLNAILLVSTENNQVKVINYLNSTGLSNEIWTHNYYDLGSIKYIALDEVNHQFFVLTAGDRSLQIRNSSSDHLG